MIQVAEGAIIIITEHSNTETSFIASLLCFHTWECLDSSELDAEVKSTFGLSIAYAGPGTSGECLL